MPNKFLAVAHGLWECEVINKINLTLYLGFTKTEDFKKYKEELTRELFKLKYRSQAIHCTL